MTRSSRTRRGVLLVAALVILTTPRLLAQSSGSVVAFDVVSIKPATASPDVLSGATFRFGFGADGMFVLTAAPISFLIGMAHPNVSLNDIVGMPGWVTTDRYQVLGKLAPGARTPTADQQAALLRAVLAERFHFRGHTEARPMAAYDLVPATSGIVTSGVWTPASGDMPCGFPYKGARFNPPAKFEGEMTMGWLATILRRSLGRPVVDRTGLTGSFCVALQAAGLGSVAGAPVPPRAAAAQIGLPSIFTAVQEQLGLKLVSTREPLDVLVVDHIERPTPN
jgi:uncharacterized protein (TIGR03435 family)